MTKYKYLKKLWERLSYYVNMGYWDKANNISNKIDEQKQSHRLANFFACVFHAR